MTVRLDLYSNEITFSGLFCQRNLESHDWVTNRQLNTQEDSYCCGICNVMFKSAHILYEGCSGSSWNLVIKCSNIDILLLGFEISQVDIIKLAPHS